MNGRPRGIIIAIDGPAASGKSTTASAVAEALGYCHLNSGQLYRAITWAAIDGGWIDAGRDSFERELAGLPLNLDRRPPEYVVRGDGREMGAELRSRATAERVSELAALGSVRSRVLELLRGEAEEGGVVCDGRDIGTVVFPDAELKVFLIASAAERGRRRLIDHSVKPTVERIHEEAARLEARDEADSTRELSPLRKAPDAVEIDTTGLPFAEVVSRIVDLALQAGAEPPDGS